MLAGLVAQDPPLDPRSNTSANPEATVDSLLHPWAVTIRRLLDRAGRLELDKILIDDEENIEQALLAGVQLEAVFYAGDERVSGELAARLARDVPVLEVAKRTCKKLFENDRISRVFAVARTPKAVSLQELAALPKDLVVLEDLSISGNVGAILRTSLALGAAGVVLLDASAVDLYDRRLIRSSRGYVFALPVVSATTAELLAFSRSQRARLLITAPHAELELDQVATLSERLLLVFGGEKEGCSPELLNGADLRVRIPIDPRVESLNVAAAAAIVLFARSSFNRAAAST
ncbi:MAG TPA: RNA methyltransferase [Polyangiaceae bacterium]|nr:RNA methyltransferase [Polyangiaceae bacterium]